MSNYTITLTDTEKTAMEYIALDVDEWITNAATNRARIAIDEIIQLNTAHCNANSIAIAVGKDAQVAQALSLGVIDKAADRSEPEE
jgi:hypothetical protein